ncbi:MAG TPA: PKD domain-containing protein [Candidatus Saccharimonadales bacterium]
MLRNFNRLNYIPILIIILLGLSSLEPFIANATTLSGTNGFGISGTITSPPPSTAATIATPTNGQQFSQLPITISGICVSGLLIKIYINNIFSGSADCVNSSYSISSDLFIGENDIVARDFDSLNQAGPDSNTVKVSYVNNALTAQSGITLTSSFAKLGANPGSLLSWPIQITGGSSPYALSINWGDGKQPTLLSQPTSGSLTLTHTYSISGVYNVTINATDTNNNDAFLQLVGVANGPASQSTSSNSPKPTAAKTVGLSNIILAIIIGLLVLTPLIAFWLGDMHQKKVIESKFKHRQKLF